MSGRVPRKMEGGGEGRMEFQKGEESKPWLSTIANLAWLGFRGYFSKVL